MEMFDGVWEVLMNKSEDDGSSDDARERGK